MKLDARFRLHTKDDAVKSGGPDEYEYQGEGEEEQKYKPRAISFEQRGRRIASIEVTGCAGESRPTAGEENSFAIGLKEPGTTHRLARGRCVAEIRKPRRTLARFAHFAFEDLARDRLEGVGGCRRRSPRVLSSPRKRGPKRRRAPRSSRVPGMQVLGLDGEATYSTVGLPAVPR